jgi:hypothetical protein
MPALETYYLCPRRYARAFDNYRYALTIDEIRCLPDDLNASTDDCDLIGDFYSYRDAWEAAKKLDPDNINPVQPD